jgi:hypothetical protein
VYAGSIPTLASKIRVIVVHGVPDRFRELCAVAASIKVRRRIDVEQAQLIQAAACIAGGMAAAHYDKFSGLVATRITDIAETAVKIARAIELEARKQP